MKKKDLEKMEQKKLKHILFFKEANGKNYINKKRVLNPN